MAAEPSLRVKAPGEQVFLDGEVAEAVAAFQHLDAAAPHQVVGREALDALALEFDRTLGHLATLGMEQVETALRVVVLAGAVGAENGDDAAPRHVQGDALQNQDDVIVDHFDIVDPTGSDPSFRDRS